MDPIEKREFTFNGRACSNRKRNGRRNVSGITKNKRSIHCSFFTKNLVEIHWSLFENEINQLEEKELIEVSEWIYIFNETEGDF